MTPVIDEPVITGLAVAESVIEVKVPGKIMIAGEWSVLEQGNSCIVLPVQKYVYVQIKAAVKFIFNSQDIDLMGVCLLWNRLNSPVLELESCISSVQKDRFNLCFTVMQKGLQFLDEQGIAIKPFELTVISEISGADSTPKPGLGSSAAVAVAVCKAILQFHGFNTELAPNLDIVFKLACISHFIAFGKVGSGFDVACSTYKKPIIYSRFDPDWLKSRLKFGQNLVM